MRAVPLTLNSEGAVYDMFSFVDGSKICFGNHKRKYLDQWQQ